MNFKIKISLIVFTILFVLLFSLGQEGCELEGYGNSSQTKNSGLTIELVKDIDTLSSGKEIEQDETFYVSLKLKNYDERDKNGRICIRDNYVDTFGGIRDTCKSFVISQSYSGGGTSGENEGILDLYFPEEGAYYFHDMPEMENNIDANLEVNLEYDELSKITGTVVIPSSQPPIVYQNPASVLLLVEQSMRKFGESYKLTLDFSFTKNQDVKIYLPDFKEDSLNQIFFDARLGNNPLTCQIKGGKQVGNIITLDGRTIRCETTLYQSNQETSYPLVVTLHYGIQQEAKYPFQIKTNHN